MGCRMSGQPFELRPYQAEAIRAVIAAYRAGISSALITLPTGAGKTVVFSEIARRIMPRRTLIIAHREELLAQAASKIGAVAGIVPGMEKGRMRSAPGDVVVSRVVPPAASRWDNGGTAKSSILLRVPPYHLYHRKNGVPPFIRHFRRVCRLNVIAVPPARCRWDSGGDKKTLVISALYHPFHLYHREKGVPPPPPHAKSKRKTLADEIDVDLGAPGKFPVSDPSLTLVQ